MHDLLHTLNADMIQLPVPWIEKILRPMLMYLVLITLLRIFGKRELAQLNPFDLVVLLTLSNTVQNAIIGNDNSFTGGVIEAVALLTTNWLLMRFLYKSPKVHEAFEGEPTVLIHYGRVDKTAMDKEALTHEDLISVLNKNGFNDIADVEECRLEPNGTFFVKGKQPSPDDLRRDELMKAIEKLTGEVRDLRAKLRVEEA